MVVFRLYKVCLGEICLTKLVTGEDMWICPSCLKPPSSVKDKNSKLTEGKLDEIVDFKKILKETKIVKKIDWSQLKAGKYKPKKNTYTCGHCGSNLTNTSKSKTPKWHCGTCELNWAENDGGEWVSTPTICKKCGRKLDKDFFCKKCKLEWYVKDGHLWSREPEKLPKPFRGIDWKNDFDS